jgi:hypothetical protein
MNPFISVFTDTADFTELDNGLSTSVEMVSIPREEWEWTQKYIAFQERMYAEMKQQLQEAKGDK